MSDSASYTFNDLNQLTRWVTLSIYLQILISIIALWSGNLEYGLLQDFTDGMYSNPESANLAAQANDTRQQLIARVEVIIFIISGILILRWIFLAGKNVRALGAQQLEISPGWSVGWYFVPVLSLWKPFQAMSEIWRASKNPANWQAESVGKIVGGWWFLWIIYSVINNVSFRYILKADTLEQLINANRLSQVAEFSALPLCLITLSLISNIHEAQLISRQSTNSKINTTQQLKGNDDYY